MREALRALIASDAEAGRLGELQKYIQAFPKSEALVREVYAEVRAERESRPPSSLGPDPAARLPEGLGHLGVLGPERLEVRRELARGGMGVIHEVHDPTLRRTLARKMLHEGVAGGLEAVDPSELGTLPALVQRLLDEAQVTAQLDHPGVVPVHEVGLDSDGRLYFTMKRVRGRTLGVILRLAREGKEGWNHPRAVRLFLRICETLAFAHDKGIVHRDLKPDNVMVGRHGEVYVMDWGLAKVLGQARSAIVTDLAEVRTQAAQDGVTLVGDVLGTPSYMAPEQAHGNPGDVDARSDVYAVGCMLYELLAGHPPYREPGGAKDARGVMLASLKGPPPRLAELDTRAPPELVSVVDKAMARAPADRYATAAELGQELQDFLDGRVVRAHKTGAVAELRKWVGRNKGLAIALLGTVLLATFGAVLFAITQRQSALALAEERDVAYAAKRRADGLRLAAQSVAMRDKDPALALALAIEGAARAPGPDANGALYGAIPLQMERFHLQSHNGYMNDLAWAPDGKSLLTCSDNGSLIHWDAETGRELRYMRSRNGSAERVRFAPTGRLAALHVDSGTVEIWDVGRGSTRALAAGDDQRFVRSAWSADGKTLYLLDDAARMHVVEAEGYERRRFQTVRSPTTDFVVLEQGDGRYLVRSDAAGTLHVVDVGTGETAGQVAPPTGAEGLAGPSLLRRLPNDPRALVVRWRGGEIARLGLPEAGSAALETVWRLRPEAGPAQAHIVVGTHGRLAVLDARAEDGGPLVDVFVDLERGEIVRESPRSPGSHPSAIGGPGDSLTAYAEGFGFATVDSFTGVRYADHGGHAYGLTRIAFDPSGRQVASASQDQTAILWHAHHPLVDHALVPYVRSGEHRMLDFSPRGDAVVAIWQSGPRKDTLSGVFDVETGRPRFLIEGDRPAYRMSRWQPNGAHLLAFSDERTLHLLDARTGREVVPAARLPEDLALRQGVGIKSLSPDGYRAVLNRSRGFSLFDLRTGRVTTAIEFDQPTGYSVAWLPDGRRFLTGDGGAGTLSLVDAERGEIVRRFSGHTGYVLRVAPLADGRHAASAAVDSTVRIWDIETGEERSRTSGFPMKNNPLIASHDGRRLVVLAEGQPWVYDVVEGALEEFALLDAGTPGRPLVVFSEANDAILTLHRDGRIKRWPLDPLAWARAHQSRRLTRQLLERYDVGAPEEREAESRRAALTGRDGYVAYRYARARLEAGDLAEAAVALERVRELRPTWFGTPWGFAALHAARSALPGLSEAERAFEQETAIEYVARSIELGHPGVANMHKDPRMAPLVGHPDFEALLER